MAAAEETYSRYQLKFGSIPLRLGTYVRRQMFEAMMAWAKPTATTTVLDVGVTSEDLEGMNFLEANYPYPSQLTATGMEDASYLEQKYPGVKFVHADARELPFGEGEFDLVVASALIEHVGSRAQQRAAVQDFCRVGKRVVVTTPNRYFPLEFHTVVPFLHWLPAPQFHRALRALGRDFYASEETLNLLAERDLLALVPPGRKGTVQRFKLLGLTSNLQLLIE